MVAWVIMWDWIGDHAKVDNRLITIVNGRMSTDRVKELVELLYSIYHPFNTEEKLAYASKKFNPYPATINGIITCGHNPFITAWKAHNIRLKKDNNNNEIFLWKDKNKN